MQPLLKVTELGTDWSNMNELNSTDIIQTVPLKVQSLVSSPSTQINCWDLGTYCYIKVQRGEKQGQADNQTGCKHANNLPWL